MNTTLLRAIIRVLQVKLLDLRSTYQSDPTTRYVDTLNAVFFNELFPNAIDHI